MEDDGLFEFFPFTGNAEHDEVLRSSKCFGRDRKVSMTDDYSTNDKKHEFDFLQRFGKFGRVQFSLLFKGASS